MNNTVDFKGQDFEFIPFGAGRRGCPGMSFALATVEYLLANLLYYFDWKLPDVAADESLDMTEVHGLTVHKKFPLLLVPALYSPKLMMEDHYYYYYLFWFIYYYFFIYLSCICYFRSIKI